MTPRGSRVIPKRVRRPLGRCRFWRFPGETAREMNGQTPHELQVEEAMMRAITILSLSGLVLAAGGAFVLIGLSCARSSACRQGAGGGW